MVIMGKLYVGDISSLMSISIFVIDDDYSFRQELSLLIKTLPGCVLAGSFENGELAFEKFKDHVPDIVLSDWSMPGMNGLEVLQQIGDYYPEVKVIMLSMHAEEAYIQAALSSGAVGYLVKEDTELALEPALKEVMRGKIYVSPSITDLVDPFTVIYSQVRNFHLKI